MRMKNLSYKIKAVIFAALICLCLSLFPGNALAAQAAFGGIFGKIEQGDTYIWEEAKAMAGYKPSASGIPEDPKFYAGSSDPTSPRTYYGRLLAQNVNEAEAERRTEAWYDKVGNAMDAYRAAVAAGSGSMQQVENGRYTTYTITSASQLAGFKRQAEALVALHATLKEAGANTSEDDIMLQDAQKTLADIASGKLTVGSTHQAHEAGNLEGSADLGSKRYDANGNLISETRIATPIFCLERHGVDVFPDFDPQGCIGLGLYYGLLKPSSWVLWAAGVAFNYSIDFTLNFGKFIRDQGLGKSGSGAIYLGWSAIRDLINVGFIFILLYAAISTIVGLDGYGVKKTVVKVVIAALLLNFSLFFTKALIDMSNLIALQFYTRVLTAADQANGTSNALTRGDSNGDDWDSGLSIGFVNALGLKSIWGGSIRNANSSGAGEANSAFGSINAGQLIIICLGGSAFILVTAFTLFMATLRFLYRSIVLIFLMILSPIGFVGGAIPALKGAAGKWQSRLKNNLIFAPAYMAIFYVVALIVFGKGIGPSQVDVNSGAGLTGFGALFQGNVSSTGLLFWFVMIIGLMMGTQIAADQFADKMGMADSFKKKAKGWAAGAMAMAPRRVLGGTADALIKNTAVKAVLARVPGGGIVMSGLDKVRGAKMFGTTSFKDKMKEDQKKTEDRAKLFKEGRELTQYKDESPKEFEARKKAVKRRATNAASAYLGMGGPLGLVGKGEVTKEDLAEAGKTGRLVQATRYIPIIGSSLEKMRRKNQAARKTVFEGDREEKDKALKSELETKLATAISDLEIYSSSVAYKNETTAIQTRVDQAKELVKNSVTAAELATHNATLRREMKALNAHTKEAKALEKQIREFKDKISQIDSRKKDGK